MKPIHAAMIAVVGLFLFLTGIGAGIWFAMNYRVVPVDQAISPQPPPASAETQATTGLPQPPAAATSGFKVASSPSRSAPLSGPFAYRFAKGEQLKYQLSAEVAGTGFDMGEGSGIGLSIGSNLSLVTESVDTAGAGALRLAFDDVYMTGNFMGTPVEIHHSAGRTTMNVDGRTQVDTAQGHSIKGIAQLQFFQQPVRMVVARDGEVLHVSGVQGLDQMLSSIITLNAEDLPTSDLPAGREWTSEFNMPIPGLGTPARAIARNKLDRYTTINGRRCAVVHQDIESTQSGGLLASPASILGEAMQFSMPTFSISGQNVIYFDTDDGKLVHCDMDIDFALELGEQLKPLADLLGMYGELLDEIEGGPPKGQQQPQAQESLLDMGVNIKAILDLAD